MATTGRVAHLIVSSDTPLPVVCNDLRNVMPRDDSLTGVIETPQTSMALERFGDLVSSNKLCPHSAS